MDPGTEPPKRPLSFVRTTVGNTRLLRATEITLRKDQITIGTDWTYGTGLVSTELGAWSGLDAYVKHHLFWNLMLEIVRLFG